MQKTDGGKCLALHHYFNLASFWLQKKFFDSFLCPSQQRDRGSRLNILIIAEGAINRQGLPITCDDVKEVSNSSAVTHKHIGEVPVILDCS